jgi:hypothetical protein
MYRRVLSSVVDVVGVVIVIECGGKVAINSSSPLVSSEAEVPQPTPATLPKPCRQGCDVQHFYFRRMLMITLLIIRRMSHVIGVMITTATSLVVLPKFNVRG